MTIEGFQISLCRFMNDDDNIRSAGTHEIITRKLRIGRLSKKKNWVLDEGAPPVDKIIFLDLQRAVRSVTEKRMKQGRLGAQISRSEIRYIYNKVLQLLQERMHIAVMEKDDAKSITHHYLRQTALDCGQLHLDQAEEAYEIFKLLFVQYCDRNDIYLHPKAPTNIRLP